MDQIRKEPHGPGSSGIRRQTSMGTLIMWNITKAIEANPNIDLKTAILATQERLEHDGGNAMAGQSVQDQYIACALLAWQQLGHTDAESLYRFVETKRKEYSDNEPSVEKIIQTKRPVMCHGSFISYEDSKLSKGVGSGSYDSYSLVGPVVKLPMDTKIVMRLDNQPSRPAPGRRKLPDNDLKNKIDAACCMESACMEKLTALDKATTELRVRAQRLARREAERVELLERAEAAWKDLELGYQRRLALAEEKEEDMAKHIQKLIEERNSYKSACTTLAKSLRERGEVAEKERAKLTEIEKELCEKACMRLRVSEEAAKLDAGLSEQQCKASQLDRDLQFKEEQIRRKLQALESELESIRALTCEAERALHAELSVLRQQVAKVSGQLLEEDAVNAQIKEELELLRQEKLEMVEDLDGCKILCDGKIQAKMDNLKRKREQLKELKERVMECQCKMPVDASVEVKRTPSLAALCKCSPEDKFLDSCSCTSLRTTLLSNLLADLFGGLQAELGGCTVQMPCQLLKCLEDRHNWDKSSIVKTNLRNYFSQLLVGELDIAIATSIEKYHAKWVGASCADAARMIPDRGGPETEGWQERALERRAQKLAAELAEQLFQERAEQLTAKAKEIVATGPPPCECKPRPAAVYSCLVKPPTINSAAPTANSGVATPGFWRRTHQDVAQLKTQIEDLKKDSIKKEDLKIMEENIVKLVQRATVTEEIVNEPAPEQQKTQVTRNSIHRSVNTDQALKHCVPSKVSSIMKKQSDLIPKKNNKILGIQIEKPVRSFKKLGRSYAVNLCLCGSQKDKKSLISKYSENKKSLKHLATRDTVPQISSRKRTKPIVSNNPSLGTNIGKKSKLTHPPCQSGLCFHKPPSNTSIDKLLETLAKWKCDLSNLDSNCNTEGRKKHDAKTNIDLKEGEYKDVRSDTKKEKELEKKRTNNVSTKYSTNEYVAPFRSRIVVANICKSTEFQNVLPANTESEYMGAINLDKSNENVCRCVSGIINKLEQINEPKPQILKCITTEVCPCHKSDMKNKNTMVDNGLGVNKKNKQKSEYTQNAEISNQTGSKLESDINKIVKTSTLFPNDCEYCIKFLGVTLTNASSNNEMPEKDKVHKNENLPSFKVDKQKNNRREVWYNNVSSKSIPPVEMPTCDCSVKFGSDNRDQLNNGSMKQHGDFRKNEDKSLDTSSFKYTSDHESCVCCKAAKIDESKDLEVNAFHLLEEHLRDKLEEFKSSNCKSYCIPPEEEDKVFFTILQKVKKIITDSTNVIACKCSSEESAEGSWHRAYLLLQEYLRIKIKRVQCLCLSPIEEKETVLPNVMEQVCKLIDNDFQRLKEICKCRNNSKINLDLEIPEKDNCHTHENETNTTNDLQNIDTLSKEVSNKSLIVTQNISSQITPNINTETKSCDIMEMCNRDIDTGHANTCSRITKLNYNYCYCINSSKATKSSVDIFGNKDLLINPCIHAVEEGKEIPLSTNMQIKQESELLSQLIQPKSNTVLNQNLEKKPDVRKSTPYIGYTVDCSCDRTLGTCICTKSMISGKNDNINSIWNTLTSNKLRHIDISYIMDAVPNKGSTEDLKRTQNFPSHQPVAKTMCDTKVSAQKCDDLILKDSKLKMNKTFLSTTTSGEDIKFASHTERSMPMEWYQYSSNAKQKPHNINDCCDNTCDDSLYYPVRNLMNQGTNEDFVKSETIRSISSSCDCNMVPMCHVKMLVENIENKLMHSKCTCDSLCSKICPVHSKKH